MVQGYIRKKDVQMSRLGVYISIVIVLCHSVRLLPNTWELIQRHQVLAPENITWITVTPGQVRDTTLQDYSWPLWMDVTTMLSNLGRYSSGMARLGLGGLYFMTQIKYIY